jgi:hypothetical protein
MGTRDELDVLACKGARHLLDIADRTDGCRVYHHEPDGKDLYYLGWCHGPAGTARLFRQLETSSTCGAEFEGVAIRCGESLLASGIPAARTPGFWNNVSACCGSAGVAELALDLFASTGERRWLDFAIRLADDVLARATRDESGLRWVQAEHRAKPDLLVAQTGHMQGAAGVGRMLLRVDATLRGETLSIRFPDTPFDE